MRHGGDCAVFSPREGKYSISYGGPVKRLKTSRRCAYKFMAVHQSEPFTIFRPHQPFFFEESNPRACLLPSSSEILSSLLRRRRRRRGDDFLTERHDEREASVGRGRLLHAVAEVRGDAVGRHDEVGSLSSVQVQLASSATLSKGSLRSDAR